MNDTKKTNMYGVHENEKRENIWLRDEQLLLNM